MVGRRGHRLHREIWSSSSRRAFDWIRRSDYDRDLLLRVTSRGEFKSWFCFSFCPLHVCLWQFQSSTTDVWLFVLGSYFDRVGKISARSSAIPVCLATAFLVMGQRAWFLDHWARRNRIDLGCRPFHFSYRQRRRHSLDRAATAATGARAPRFYHGHSIYTLWDGVSRLSVYGRILTAP